MTHCWLLTQMRQPGRHLYSHFTRMTFIDFLSELLSERNFLMDKTIGDNRVVRPDWSLCMGYELELRREAIKYTRERAMAIQEALWAAYNNEHHRLENFSNFLRFSGSASSASTDKDKTVQQLQKKSCRLGKTNSLSFTSRSQAATCSSRSGEFFVHSVGPPCSTCTQG